MPRRKPPIRCAHCSTSLARELVVRRCLECKRPFCSILVRDCMRVHGCADGVEATVGVGMATR